MSFWGLIYIFLGGGFGALARYSLTLTFPKSEGHSLAWSTLIANILASLILGFVIGYIQKHPSESLRYLIAIGFCGAFSTFSTFSLENFEFLMAGKYSMFFIYALTSVFVCLVSVFIGLKASLSIF